MHVIVIQMGVDPWRGTSMECYLGDESMGVQTHVDEALRNKTIGMQTQVMKL